ncbi:Organic solvent tolerance protein [Maridesulfovibrio hydrothermalis AM13 = DSM 14728]|uniref:Organic solvent tolerance protein n=1 Tax=Maridesulfovibrio hydrothermalis AM13 = DSM 14728 TaxID=1121451 RepID=L0RBL7_9BACT|nr:Organic solvent tolerance protein [Maridesulfovibrio hydrothermalis AM13 = DSM 14728]
MPMTNSKGVVQKGEEWKFSADKLVVENDSEYLQAYGNVTLRSGKNYIQADFARFYQATKWIYLRGNVKAQVKGDFYDAAEAEFDLNNMVGWLKKGRVFVAKPHVIFEGDFIEKHNGASYSFKDVKVTACEGDNPLWSFESGEGDITINGYARLWHSKFNIKGVPVMYTPYMELPVARERQSGVLTPEVGTSDRLGGNINIPYYWAINDEMDMTVYGQYLTKRGFRPGVDFRHAGDADTKGQWRGDWLYDGKAYDNTADADNAFQNDGMIRPNHNRWWVRSKFNGYLGSPEWQTIFDLDIVSDQDYLREYRSGLNGYESTREDFLEQFGRDIATVDATTRTSTALVARSWDNYAISGLAQYNDNLLYRNGNRPASDDPTLQKLPQVNAYAFKNNFFGTPLEWQGEFQGDYFWREYGTTGGRFDIRPELSMPVRAGGITFIPRAAFRATSYLVESFQNASADASKDSSQTRFMADAGISAVTDFYRVFDFEGAPDVTKENIGKSSWTRMKHNIVPRLEYSWVQDESKSQTKLPYFDSRDRISEQNDIVFSLTNVFDRSKGTVVLGEDGQATMENSYLEFLRIRMEQGYDIDEENRSIELSKYEKRPFSDFMAEFIVTPHDYVELSSRTWVSPYLGDVTEHENILKLFHDSYGEVLLGYDYLRKIDEYKRQQDTDMQIVKYGLKAYLPYGVAVGGTFRADLNNDRDLEKTVTLGWNHQCFLLEFVASKTTVDERYSVNFNLFNMGQF